MWIVPVACGMHDKVVNRAAQLALPLLSFFLQRSCSVPRSGVKRLPRSGGVPRKLYFYFQILS